MLTLLGLRAVPSRFTRKAEEPMADQGPDQRTEQNGDQEQGQAENGNDDMEDAEDEEADRDSQEPEEAALETMPSPVALEEQDNPDLEDRWAG